MHIIILFLETHLTQLMLKCVVSIRHYILPVYS